MKFCCLIPTAMGKLPQLAGETTARAGSLRAAGACFAAVAVPGLAEHPLSPSDYAPQRPPCHHGRGPCTMGDKEHGTAPISQWGWEWLRSWPNRPPPSATKRGQIQEITTHPKTMEQGRESLETAHFLITLIRTREERTSLTS